jgi:protein-tyrosine phosphatase
MSEQGSPTRVLMVCLGNICRSPMAEGILRYMAVEGRLSITTDSAGTSDYHRGELPDRRALAAMRKHGIDISDLRARPFQAEDYDRFDVILAMDRENLQNMLRLAPSKEHARKARLIMDHAPDHPLREVPDPYYGGDQGFEEVYRMLTEACNNLINDIGKRG